MLKLIFEKEHSIDPEFEITAYTDKIHVHVEEDWCGDSITGFGATMDFDWNREQVLKLRNFFDNFLGEK